MRQKEIMIVDDERGICEAFKGAFEQAGYMVETAESAEDALEIIKRKPYFVFFLDLNLPKMNGLELCRQIKKDWPMAICHAVTGYASFFEIHGCREAGFDDYFTKPVNFSKLLFVAENAFERLDRWMSN